MLGLGIDPSRILFANPCKSPASLLFAQQSGVTRTVFDNLDELDKIKTYLPGAELLLRIYANDDSALISFGGKFGAHLETTPQLLARARELELQVTGVSFHVGKKHLPPFPVCGFRKRLTLTSGTGAKSAAAFVRAIQHARIAFSHAERLGFQPTILDIGGGFQDCNFEPIATYINAAIQSEFPRGVTVIAEPGRFFARTAYTLVCRVLSRRRQLGNAAAAGVPDALYQSDGVYGNFMNVMIEKEVPTPELVERKGRKQWARPLEKNKTANGAPREEYRYSVWGPTCDSVDCVVQEAAMDSEVQVGDWLKYRNMGGECPFQSGRNLSAH